MQLYGGLILFLTLSTACGLRCYDCLATDPKSCTDIITCPDGFNRCASVTVFGLITRSCLTSDICISPITCCEEDLCNSATPTGPSNNAISTGPSNNAMPTDLSSNAIPTGPSVILLLVSSAIITLFF